MSVAVVSPVTEMVRVRCERSPRIVLFTDATTSDTLPESIRTVADEAQYGSLSGLNQPGIPNNFDGALIWCSGESVLCGSPAEWRRPFFSTTIRATSIAIHWPYLEHADLLGFEPRLLNAQATGTAWNPLLRVSGTKPSDKRRTAWRANGKPWARLSLTLWQEMERPSSGIDSLLELWNSNSGDSRFSALVLRNLIVVLMKGGKWEKAGELLDLGTKAFPGCAEFLYLHAVYFILQESPLKALRYLEGALNCTGTEYVGSGGESSYRARFLLGSICDLVGQQEKAVSYWIACALERPAFEPAVRALTGQRLPHGHSKWLYQPLAELARRESHYLECVVGFLLAHKMTHQSRLLVETTALDAARREKLLTRVGDAELRLNSRPRCAEVKPGVLLTGPIFDASGHSRINQAISQALLDSPKFRTALAPTTWPTIARTTQKASDALWQGSSRDLERTDLTIRHQWPPDFAPTASGKLACIVPWEHQSVPIRWVEQIEASVDEVWTPSQFAREAFLNAGLASERVRMIHNAVDPAIFRPDGPANRPQTSKGFIFLFVGGTIRRKGIDILLQAYADAFSPDEDVTLIIKDVGSRSFYRQNNRLAEVMRFAARRSSPHALVLTEEMEDAALAALYRGADAIVHPYRGEGFGMPLIEAMACGKPIITTAEGPAREFCSEEEGYLIPARLTEVPEPPPPMGPLSGAWTWFEPDIAVLAQTMRHVYEHRDEAATRGRRAAAKIAREFTWKQILPIYLERIDRLLSVSVEASSAGGS